MRHTTLITTGIVGAALAIICCATPLLVLVFGAIGLTGLIAKVDFVAMSALVLCLALIGFGVYRRQPRE